mgnify:CR=1 FL=1
MAQRVGWGGWMFKNMSNLHNEALWEQLYEEAFLELEPYYKDDYEELRHVATELAHDRFYAQE